MRANANAKADQMSTQDGQSATTARRLILVAPSALSALRLVLAGVLPSVAGPWRTAVVVVAGLTDWSDGFIARRFNATSWQGGLLDAIADKLFTLSALLTLTFDGPLRTWQLGPLLLRDVTVGSIALYGSLSGQWSTFRRVPSRMPGRITTAALFALFLVGCQWPTKAALVMAMFALAAVSSAAAAVDYLRLFLRQRRRSLESAS